MDAATDSTGDSDPDPVAGAAATGDDPAGADVVGDAAPPGTVVPGVGAFGAGAGRSGMPHQSQYPST
ncbi:hypothetical protein MOPEL_135_01040 [Mobilicoccus pelagius NBRC 104925]|uniref:Uncharacterized protein n=1 Tax=Mobilicoccus pelagius NBRC 104925 TaxID=1089455 RepID=H5UVV8_9MICO|nr:hypothetical protein MOPEL_135_01040 [Mobilicoccus pelagius NBRC 104925]